MGRQQCLHAVRHLGVYGLEAGTFYPPAVIERSEKGETFPSTVGDVHFRPEDHQLVRPVIIVRGKALKDMKDKEDYGRSWMSSPGRRSCRNPTPSAASSVTIPDTDDPLRRSARRGRGRCASCRPSGRGRFGWPAGRSRP